MEKSPVVADAKAHVMEWVHVIQIFIRRENKMISKGFLWTAYGINHTPLNGYKTLFALNREDAIKRFNNEYGNDSSILYLVPDTFNYWDSDNNA